MLRYNDTGQEMERVYSYNPGACTGLTTISTINLSINFKYISNNHNYF